MNKLVRTILYAFAPKWACRMEKQQRDNYMLLDRLRQDCDYYINESSNPNYLWAGNEVEQIANMKKLYRSLVIKPEYLSMKDIKRYKRLMIKH